MTRFALAFVVGFGAALAIRWARVEVPVPVAPSRLLSAGPTARPARWTSAAPERPPVPSASRAPDLVPGDALIAHHLGDPLPWDSPAAQAEAEARLRAEADAFEASGAGEVITIDCAVYPCLAVVETAPGSNNDVTPVANTFESARIDFGDDREGPGGDYVRLVLRQAVTDVGGWDAATNLRSQDLVYPPELVSEEEAAQPIEWPQVRR